MLLLGSVALVWANLPYLAGYLVEDQHLVYSGFFIFEQDGYSYLAKMRQGAEGSWLFHLPYTTEPQQGVLLYVLYLLIGKITRWLGIPLVAGYHLARLFGTGILLASAARFVRQFATTTRWQLASWTLLLFGGGVGWLISVFNPQYVAYASTAPDAFLYSVLFGPPHVIIALAILLWLLTGTSRQLQSLSADPPWRAWGTLAIGGLLMALARPEYMAVLLSVLGACWLVLVLRHRRVLIRKALLLGGIALPGTLYALYVYTISKTVPAIAAWTAQNPFFTPPLLNLLAGMGPLLLMGALGLVSGRWWREKSRLLLVAWTVVLPAMLYLPLSLSRRMAGGAQFALALPAGYWLDQHLLPWLQKVRWRKVIVGPPAALLALILISYPLLFGLGAINFVSSRPDKLFLPTDEMAALTWLAGQGDGRIVLSAEQTGNHIPAFSSATPVLGHPIETLAVDEKRADVARFYATGTSPAERQAILARYEVDTVWWGPAERELGRFSPVEMDRSRQLFRKGQVEIWQID